MEKGPVNLHLVARIKAHPLYDARPMVKVRLTGCLTSVNAISRNFSSRSSVPSRRQCRRKPRELLHRQVRSVSEDSSTLLYNIIRQLVLFYPSHNTRFNRNLQDLVRRSGHSIRGAGAARVEAAASESRTKLQERPWNSVEVRVVFISDKVTK